MAALLSARPTFRFERDNNGITARETHARIIPGILCSGARLCQRSLPDSKAIYTASNKKQRPTIRNARFSFRSRSPTFASTDIRHSKTDPDVTSMKLSIPNPTSEMLPATRPAPTATMPSTAFQMTVKYSSRRPNERLTFDQELRFPPCLSLPTAYCGFRKLGLPSKLTRYD